MKDLAEADESYPKLLEHMRTLCRFFRNATYRAHIQNLLRGTCDVKVLDAFTAGF